MTGAGRCSNSYARSRLRPRRLRSSGAPTRFGPASTDHIDFPLQANPVALKNIVDNSLG